MSGDQNKKKRKWWIVGAGLLAVVLIAVGIGVGVRLAAPRQPEEPAATGGADPAPPTAEGLSQVHVPGASGCVIDNILSSKLPEGQQDIQAPPQAAGAVEFAGFMTAFLVTTSQDVPEALLTQDEYADLFVGTPWGPDAWEEFLQYRSISQPSHEFTLTNAHYWVTAANESEVNVIVVGPYTSYGSETEEEISALPLAGMQYTIVADDSKWKIAKAEAFSEADHSSEAEQILAEGEEFSDPC